MLVFIVPTHLPSLGLSINHTSFKNMVDVIRVPRLPVAQYLMMQLGYLPHKDYGGKTVLKGHHEFHVLT